MDMKKHIIAKSSVRGSVHDPRVMVRKCFHIIIAKDPARIPRIIYVKSTATSAAELPLAKRKPRRVEDNH
jgi:hypothetical protein